MSYDVSNSAPRPVSAADGVAAPRTRTDRAENVCVIGAGAAGLTAIKNLREYGFGVDCYERETGVGGAWNWRHDRSPVYASTHLISSKPFTQFPDFPMPDSWPDYPHHTQVLAYLERYADHFGLREHIWFGTEVTRVDAGRGRPLGRHDQRRPRRRLGPHPALRRRGGGQRAQLVAEAARRTRGMGDFEGEMIHASAYKDAAQLRGKRVLVVGAGNTGCDIAVEAAQQAARCWHSSRRGYWYAPKYAYGRPADQVNDLVSSLRLPLRLRQWLFHRTLRRTVGDLTRFGLPRAGPQGATRRTRSRTASSSTTSGHGSITPVPDVARFTRDTRRVHRRPGGRAGPGRPGHRLPAPVRVPRPGTAQCGRRGPAAAVPARVLAGPPDAGGGRSAAARLGRLLADALAGGRPSRPGCGCASRPRSRPPRSGAGTIAEFGERYNQAKVKQSTRHWFEVSHVDYLRAVEKTLREMEAAA